MEETKRKEKKTAAHLSKPLEKMMNTGWCSLVEEFWQWKCKKKAQQIEK
jgi:hypothetical protein